MTLENLKQDLKQGLLHIRDHSPLFAPVRSDVMEWLLYALDNYVTTIDQLGKFLSLPIPNRDWLCSSNSKDFNESFHPWANLSSASHFTQSMGTLKLYLFRVVIPSSGHSFVILLQRMYKNLFYISSTLTHEYQFPNQFFLASLDFPGVQSFVLKSTNDNARLKLTMSSFQPGRFELHMSWGTHKLEISWEQFPHQGQPYYDGPHAGRSLIDGTGSIQWSASNVSTRVRFHGAQPTQDALSWITHQWSHQGPSQRGYMRIWKHVRNWYYKDTTYQHVALRVNVADVQYTILLQYKKGSASLYNRTLEPVLWFRYSTNQGCVYYWKKSFLLQVTKVDSHQGKWPTELTILKSPGEPALAKGARFVMDEENAIYSHPLILPNGTQFSSLSGSLLDANDGGKPGSCWWDLHQTLSSPDKQPIWLSLIQSLERPSDFALTQKIGSSLTIYTQQQQETLLLWQKQDNDQCDLLYVILVVVLALLIFVWVVMAICLPFHEK